MSGSNLTNRVAKLSPAKRALLEKHLRERGFQSPPLQTIPRRAEREFAPLSFAQQRLWFLNQLEPESAAYNEGSALRLTGQLDPDALQQAMEHIVNRHEVLRTTFVAVDGNPTQKINPPRTIEIPVLDLTSANSEERDREVERLTRETIRRPFDLTQDLMLRPLLIRLADQEHLLILVQHHIASDGWSSQIFRRELAALYEASAKRETPALAELPIQYADYAVWQREWLRGDTLESQLSYWKKQLAGVPALRLPTDHPKVAGQTCYVAKHSFALSPALTDQLKTLSRREGVTLFMTLLAAFQSLLNRYSDQDDFSVGTAIAGRNRAETEALIGFFVNTLVLRADFSGNPTFRELLARVRKVALEAYDHQDVPFEKLVEELNPDRDLGGTPLFQVWFALQNAPRPALELPGVTVQPAEVGNGIAKFDLVLAMVETPAGLTGRFDYSAALFEPSTIERIADHFRILLEKIAADPEQRSADLPMLTEAERHSLLAEWNDTKRDYPENKRVHELFEEQAEKTPDAVAAVFADRQLTYRQLNARANQLAHYLRKRGVGPEVLVGICIERSLETVVGLLAILKAGGAYLPLDPGYPKERLAFMLEDSRVSALLTLQRLAEKLPNPSAEVICLDSHWDAIAEESEKDLPAAGASANLAYVIYTSGSTGTPKGVMIPHRALVAHCLAAAQHYGHGPKDRVLQFASLSFDVATEEIFSTWLSGASVALLPGQAPAISDFMNFLEREKITVVDLPAPYWHQWVSELPRLKEALPAALRLVIVGSDKVSPGLFAVWQEAVGKRVRWMNAYGPTEATVTTTLWEAVSLGQNLASVPIGRPIFNKQVYILDRSMQPAPIGVPGELHIGGAGVARGYLDRPELTAEKFIPDPFSAIPGARLYKTGDLARYLPDGNIEFIGRRDHQVKVRGFRIEPGEIESVLARHPSVREAVVLAREDDPRDVRLIAYAVLREKSAAKTNDLRSHLKAMLPDYMVPSAFVFLDCLPLTPAGKVDRNSLPAPDRSRPGMEEGYAAPRTLLEELIADIWAAVLRLEKVGIQDNFFDLGGHSLLATQVASRMRESLQVEFPLRLLFETPTVSGLAGQVEEIQRKFQGTQALPIIAVSRKEYLPLSFAQQRLWFLDQLEPESGVYNIPSALRIGGPLDVAALERCLEEVARRHEALRTVFSKVHGEPVQTILPSLKLPISVVDLSDLPENKREAEVRRRAVEESQRYFDLTTGPLVRVAALRLGQQDHVLLLTMHHIVSDGWSSGILFRELSALYAAFTQGKLSPLNELTIQYADFASWQRDWLEGEVLERQLSYWKAKLDGAAPLELPTDRLRPPVRSYRGGKRSFVLDKKAADALRTLSRHENATLFMTLLAAFQLLLHRYTSQDDIVVGSPIAGRTRPEIEDLIGFFVNTLVLRNDFSGNPTFKEVLARVRQVCLDAYTHQDVPFEKLVEELRPDRSLSQNPLFQVMFVLQNAPAEALRFGDAVITSLTVGAELAKFDLTLSMREEAEGLRAVLNYSTDIFDGTTIDRMTGHLQTLLKGIAADPDRRIADLPILTESEKHRLLVEWNDTRKDYPKDRCVHQLFEAQVEKTPGAVAVVFEDQRLTYRQLNARANQLAHYLRKRGVGPEVLVAICMERSLDMIVGLLGILKAGGAYVPLDPEYPKDRLQFMLEDTRAPVLLTERKLAQRFPDCGARLVRLDGEREELAREPCENLESGGAADQAAYVIYTSGSTGTPKGVRICHRSIARLLFGIDYVRLDSRQTFLHLAPIAFDASTFEIWGALLHGAQCIVPPRGFTGPVELGRILHRHKVSVLWLTASLFNTVIDQAPEALSEVRQLLIGGEALSVPHVRRALSLLPLTQIVNGYGPTESTTFACCYPIPSRLDETIASIPIGRPIGNTQVYILDAHLNPVTVGAAGELYIGGDGLARDYLNRPELTEERFVLDPLNQEPGSRIYKTGDSARYLPDGNIEFLGRLDSQLKIRGFRIEPGEIETLLREHPAVRDAVVIAREDAPGDKRLVGYVIPNQEKPATTQELRNFLKEQLPEYMVPSVLVLLDSLPLTINGKVDRNALPAPDRSRPGMEEGYVAPRTLIEELLAEIWAGVLKLEKVGIQDNFFYLGGHSLLATQVVSRIRESLQVELPLRALFEKPTVGGLAEQIEESRRNAQGVQALPLIAVSREEDLPLSFAQQRLWFLDQLEPEGAVYNIPSALRIGGPFDVGALQQSIDEVVRRHETLRTVFSKAHGEPAQTILPSLKLPISVVDLSDLTENEREAEVRRRAVEESQTHFDLAHGPLVRVTILRLGQQDHVLLLTMHHIVSDGWSAGILFRELSALYAAFTQGKLSPLNELTIQYADFSSWQRDWLEGEVLERQLSYWKAKLDAAAPLELPTDRPRPPVRSHRGGKRSFVLDKKATETLRALSRHENATLFMTLLAAFQLLLHRYTSQDDIVVGSPIAGRTRPEIEDLIGFFVNTLVLRNDFSGNPTFREILLRVKQVCLDAYTHQDVPFEKLVEELHPERSLSQNPLFQVMFVLQNAPAEALRFGDAAITPLTVGAELAKFDLTLSMREEAEGLRAVLNYSTEIFDGATIERMLGHFRMLLEGIAANPEQRISDLPMLTAAEQHQILVEWNDTKKNYSTEKCVHRLFEEQVERTPDAVAAAFEDQQFTYRQLNARANQLAHYLKKLGVGPEVLVGICGERSLELVIGLLAILKAGGAYVPLDPEYPKERLGFMLSDTEAPVLLTQKRWVENFLPYEGRIVCFDTVWDAIVPESEENPAGDAKANNLAYVIYTSGTTGNPKGVMIEHKSLVNYLCWFNASPLVENLGTLPFITKPTFDASLKQIFAPLLRGGQVWILSDAITKDHAGLQKMIGARTGAGLNCVPALWQAMLDALEDDGATAPKENLSSLLLGGERLDKQLIDRTFRALPHTKIWNLYGPTETTANATVGRICPEGLPTLGRPIANTRIYILDSALRPVPIGVAGEIHIGGAGVARGYLNRHELTAEKFISDPFSVDPAARLYKSGDLARYLPDGNIQFIGRNDQQVKIRGFRIEPGEIEALLRKHAAVRDAAVIAREDAPGDNRLAGYVVPHREQTPTTTDLRNFLKSKLPDYMVPSVFVLLNKLPLMPNGKVDRNALPAPDQNRAVPDAGYVAPRTLVEELLAEIWAGVLKLEKVGIHDNFFDLGGHSLLATQVVSRIRESLQVEFPLRVLFEKPTVSGLAEQVEEARRTKHGLQARPMLRVPRERPMPLSFAQQRLWFLDLLQPNSFTYNLPSRRRFKGTLDVAVLQRSLEEIVRRHEALRTTFKTIDGTPFQVVRQESTLPFPLVDLSDRSGSEREDEVRRLVAGEARKPFDLNRGPLLRAKLLRLGREDNILLVTMHHIVSDGWSMEVFFRELAVLYEAFCNGRPSPLPELPVQYPDYAAWQRDWLQGETLESQLSYWRNQLRNVPTLELPTDRPRPPVQGFAGASESLVIDKDLSAALKSLCRRQRVTLFMMLVAGFQALLHRYTGEEDIVVGCPIAGRIRPEVEGLIGFFLNTLVLRTDVSGGPTFNALLARVRETALAAYAHQDVPFEKLLEELRPERDLSRSPLFQVFFNMVNTGDRRFEMHGLQVEDVPGDGIGSKFDLTIYVGERDDEIQLRLVYSSSLFDPNRMAELLQQYKQLLAQIVEQPERPISSYSLLTPAGAELLPDPVEELSSDWMGSVHERFARQAESLPEHPAITDPRGTWSYRELNARSNRLAHYLLAGGIQREEVVAIYGHRSAAIAWALLGVLKAGAAFLILDPGYPAARLSDYAKDAKPRGLVRLEAAGPVPDELEERLKATVRCRITLPGQKAGWTEGPLKEYSPENPVIPIGPDDLACISYTSGSTGGPKGILGRHGPLSHFLPWQASKFFLTSSDRFSMLSGLSHDPLQREIFTPLWIGASIHVPDPDAIGAPGRLSRWMAEEKITFAHLTPAVGRLLTQAVDSDCRLSSLRHAFFVGDKLTWADVDSLRRLAPAVQCVNYYGSTETQRAVSYYEIPSKPVDSSQKAVLPVGRGMPDVQLLVLNKKNGLAGIGEVGEIHMRSPHLALGYLGDDDLTRTRFVVNPFTGDRGDRLYKTGDLGRYLPDGNVEILGRNDGQIKLRGFRIESAEIETVLARHPNVREAVVTVYDNSSRDRELAGYVVLQQGADLSADELRAFLKIKLPDYMVPSVYVFLDSLPLTPNGKIDYRALPDPQSRGARGRAEYVPARDETERTLCRIWSEVLGVDRVGLDDSFFAIGGHSLLAAKLFARLDESFGRSLPLSVLFGAPTVRLLAEHYRAHSRPGAHSVLVAITESGTLPPIFGAPGVFGDLICFADVARELGAAQPFYGLQPLGLDGAEVPFESIEQMAKLYLNEIRQIQSHGPYALLGACFGSTVAYEMARQLLHAGEKVAFLGLLDPTRREGYETKENPPAMPRVVKRARAFSSFFNERLRLYRKEMQGLDIGARIRFVMQKIRSLSFTVGDRKALTRVQREVYQRDVIRANIRALDRYQRKPLNGGLQAVEIFETSNPRNTTAWSFDWKNLWDGSPVKHHVAGKDSGDMLTGENGRVLALLLRERLKEAFAENGGNPANRQRNQGT